MCKDHHGYTSIGERVTAKFGPCAGPMDRQSGGGEVGMEGHGVVNKRGESLSAYGVGVGGPCQQARVCRRLQQDPGPGLDPKAGQNPEPGLTPSATTDPKPAPVGCCKSLFYTLTFENLSL